MSNCCVCKWESRENEPHFEDINELPKTIGHTENMNMANLHQLYSNSVPRPAAYPWPYQDTHASQGYLAECGWRCPTSWLLTLHTPYEQNLYALNHLHEQRLNLTKYITIEYLLHVKWRMVTKASRTTKPKQHCTVRKLLIQLDSMVISIARIRARILESQRSLYRRLGLGAINLITWAKCDTALDKLKGGTTVKNYQLTEKVTTHLESSILATAAAYLSGSMTVGPLCLE